MNATPSRDAGRKAAKRKPKASPTRKRRTAYKYDPTTHPELAHNYCLLGATLDDLARHFKVAPSTVDLWMTRYEAFRKAVNSGRAEADARVAQSLYRRAMGYSHAAVKIAVDAKTGESAEHPYTEHYPPDTVACIFWLKNRQPTFWRDKIVAEQTGPEGGPVQVTQTVQAAPELAAVLERMRGVGK
jgi:transposase-like protein